MEWKNAWNEKSSRSGKKIPMKKQRQPTAKTTREREGCLFCRETEAPTGFTQAQPGKSTSQETAFSQEWGPLRQGQLNTCPAWIRGLATGTYAKSLKTK